MPASCWGCAVSHAPPIHLFAFSGFEGAQTASARHTKRPPIGPESCWGSAVSHACPPGRPIHLFAFSGFEGASTASARHTKRPPIGPESCWGSAVSHACPPGRPIHLFAFSGFEGASTASARHTKRPPIGPESCWGSAVSHACPPGRYLPFADWVHPTIHQSSHQSHQGLLASFMTALRACQLVAGRAPPHLWPARACLHPAGDVPFRTPHPSTSLLLADSKALKRHRLGTPNGHPLGLNPAGVLLFRMRAHRAVTCLSRTGFILPFTSHPTSPTKACLLASWLPCVLASSLQGEHHAPHLWPARACLHPAGDVPFRMPHPSISLLLADSKVLKRHRLGTPNGHPLGLNPARVLLFRTRAHRAVTCL